jgi:hypothetical protein
MRAAFLLLLLLGLAACSSQYRELPMVSSSDPVWRLNPDKWATNVLTPQPTGPSFVGVSQ